MTTNSATAEDRLAQLGIELPEARMTICPESATTYAALIRALWRLRVATLQMQ
jgi:hypothetical protein